MGLMGVPIARSKEKLWRLQVGEATHMPTHLTEATH